MAQYIDKSALLAEIERLKSIEKNRYAYITMEAAWIGARNFIVNSLISFLDTLEVKDPYEQYVQYDSIKAGIQAHAETYSFNIESELFNQLTKEQQALWRKEIEQAVISGCEVGVELAKDIRYKENVEVKEVDLNEEINNYFNRISHFGKIHLTPEYDNIKVSTMTIDGFASIAKHFFELGVSNSTKVTTPDIEDVLKENGVNPYSKEAKIIKESYYMALEKLKAQKGEKI